MFSKVSAQHSSIKIKPRCIARYDQLCDIFRHTKQSKISLVRFKVFDFGCEFDHLKMGHSWLIFMILLNLNIGYTEHALIRRQHFDRLHQGISIRKFISLKVS